jgi:hypothetical protein
VGQGDNYTKNLYLRFHPMRFGLMLLMKWNNMVKLDKPYITPDINVLGLIFS